MNVKQRNHFFRMIPLLFPILPDRCHNCIFSNHFLMGTHGIGYALSLHPGVIGGKAKGGAAVWPRPLFTKGLAYSLVSFATAGCAASSAGCRTSLPSASSSVTCWPALILPSRDSSATRSSTSFVTARRNGRAP